MRILNNVGSNIIADALKKGLYTTVVGSRFIYHKRLASTMDEAVSEARKGTIEGTVLLTDEQTAGRGRFERQWFSGPGDLMFSVVFYPTSKELPFISVLTALAIVRTIERETELLPNIKWPNDIFVNGKKICGLLVENMTKGNSIGYSIVGIGLNVGLNVKLYPEISDIATSITMESNSDASAASLFKGIIEELDNLYLALKDGYSPIEEWKQYLSMLGQNVEISFNDEIVSGLADGVDEFGHLIVRTSNDKTITVMAGEATFKHM